MKHRLCGRGVGAKASCPQGACMHAHAVGVMRQALMLMLAIALAASALPAPALAATRSIDGDVGMRVEVVAEAAGNQEAEFGIRVSVAEADMQFKEIGEIGVRVSLPSAEELEDAASGYAGESGNIGIRVSLPSAAALAREESGTIGVRVSADFATRYTVSFNSMGGTSVASQEVLHGELAKEPDDPVWEGHEFLFWGTAPEGDERYDFGAEVLTDVVLYAHWAQLIDVTFHGCGGEILNRDTGQWTTDDWTWQSVWTGKTSYEDGGKYELPNARRNGCRFLGWWTMSGGEWADHVQPGDEVSADHTDLYARWAVETVDVVFDGDGGDVGMMRDDVTLTYEEPPATDISRRVGEGSDESELGDWLAPTKDGSRFVGFWGGSGSDAVLYYDIEWTDDGSGRWELSDALADGWTLLEHAEDRKASDGSPVDDAHPADGVADTVVLVAHWAPVMDATLPVSVGFALRGMADESPVAVGPDKDAFAIRNYTPAALSVESVAVEGIASGLESVMYTAGTESRDEGRALDYAALDSDVMLTLDPEGNPEGRMEFAVCGPRAAPGGTAGTAVAEARKAGALFVLDPWKGLDASGDDVPGMLHIQFGLQIPDNVRPQDSGSRGDIAKVTFTLVMQETP